MSRKSSQIIPCGEAAEEDRTRRILSWNGPGNLDNGSDPTQTSLRTFETPLRNYWGRLRVNFEEKNFDLSGVALTGFAP